jgi:hypothetical protein
MNGVMSGESSSGEGSSSSQGRPEASSQRFPARALETPWRDSVRLRIRQHRLLDRVRLLQRDGAMGSARPVRVRRDVGA